MHACTPARTAHGSAGTLPSAELLEHGERTQRSVPCVFAPFCACCTQSTGCTGVRSALSHPVPMECPSTKPNLTLCSAQAARPRIAHASPESAYDAPAFLPAICCLTSHSNVSASALPQSQNAGYSTVDCHFIHRPQWPPSNATSTGTMLNASCRMVAFRVALRTGAQGHAREVSSGARSFRRLPEASRKETKAQNCCSMQVVVGIMRVCSELRCKRECVCVFGGPRPRQTTRGDRTAGARTAARLLCSAPPRGTASARPRSRPRAVGARASTATMPA